MTAARLPTTTPGRALLRVLDAARDIPANRSAAASWEKMDPDMQTIGGLSWPSKMPGAAFGLPPEACNVGARMAQIPGTICHGCYAMRGKYALDAATAAQQRRLILLYGQDHATWVNAFVRVLRRALKKPADKFFRWHDAGDIQGLWHLERIVDVARQTPEIRHWLPTREIAVVRAYLARDAFPENLTVRLSGNKPDQPAPSLPGCTTSTVYTWGKNPPQGEPCKAYIPADNGVGFTMRAEGCGDCRLCWSVTPVAYPFH